VLDADVEEKSSIFSLAKAKGMPEVRQFSMIPAGSSPPRSNFTDHDVIPWTETEVKSSSGAEMRVSQLDIHVRDIQSSSCSGDSVVFRLKSGVSLIVVSSLKFAISPSSFYVSGDVVFEWVRGVAKSGWLDKWPMKNQKAGMMTRRFFILRDRILSYHRVEPSSQEEASADYSMHSVKLKKGHYVHRSKHHMSSCVKVQCGTARDHRLTIPSSTQSTMRSGLNVARRKRRTTGSPPSGKESIVTTAVLTTTLLPPHPSLASPFFWKSRLEVVWHHESTTFQCLFIDAVVAHSPPAPRLVTSL
jgi:hypothetical protein